MIICICCRLLINFWFYWVIVGSVFGGMANPFTGNIATKISTNWFPSDQIAISNTISQVGSCLGSALGAFFTICLIDTEVEDKTKAEEMIFKAMLIQAIVYSSLYVLTYIFFFDKPTLPPWYFIFNY